MLRRRSIRLEHHDYAVDDAYFVTICTHLREWMFGEVVDDAMQLNVYGEIVMNEWQHTGNRGFVELDAFVVMPNHVHGIIVINHPYQATASGVGAQHAAPLHVPKRKPGGITPNNVAPGSLGAIVRGFKSAVTRQINLKRNTPGAPVWQRNYWERIIRDEREWNWIRQYIATNPAKWAEDKLYSSQ